MEPEGLRDALEVLGILPAELSVRTGAEARALKAKARKGLRRAAGILHPDVNGGDAEKTELFCQVLRLAEEIGRMEPAPRRTRTRLRIVLRHG